MDSDFSEQFKRFIVRGRNEGLVISEIVSIYREIDGVVSEQYNVNNVDGIFYCDDLVYYPYFFNLNWSASSKEKPVFKLTIENMNSDLIAFIRDSKNNIKMNVGLALQTEMTDTYEILLDNKGHTKRVEMWIFNKEIEYKKIELANVSYNSQSITGTFGLNGLIERYNSMSITPTGFRF